MNRFFSITSILLTIFVIYIFVETIFIHKFVQPTYSYPYDEAQQRISHHQLFSARRNHSRDQCRSAILSKDFLLKDLKHVLVDERRKVMFCVVPKVACTNWKRILISLETGKPLMQIQNPHSYAFNHLIGGTLRSNYTKFLFVRHPYERLVSAFENKIHKPFSDYFRSRLLKEGMRDLSFASFVDFILSKKPSELNEHWAPQHMLCNPCELRYDYIGKYETMAKDSDFILKHIFKSNLTLPRIKSQSPIGRTAMLTPLYMKALSPEAREGLYHLYKKDFEIFDYSFPN